MSKRKFERSAGDKGGKRAKKTKLSFEGSNDDVLLDDVSRLLSSGLSFKERVKDGQSPTQEPPAETVPEKFSEVEVQITELSSTGEGLGRSSASNHLYVVPFTVPGDTVTAKVIYTKPEAQYTVTDFTRVVKPSDKRDDGLIKCPYFAKCSGCQFQMMKYEDQLSHKRTVVDKAFRHFSGLESGLVPKAQETIGSPMQYGYRTKLTPHFDQPAGTKRRGRGNGEAVFKEVPPIGFMQKGTRWTVDIEDCPIGTDAVRAGMKRERDRVAREIGSYRRGATLLLRESTERRKQPSSKAQTNSVTGIGDSNAGVGADKDVDYVDIKTCITDSNALSTEYVGSYAFASPAGSFFQNNNSILPRFTQYIRDQIQQSTSADKSPLTHLIDAYCGSGLFTITLSSLFKSSIGIDIAGASIEAAKNNAELNGTKNTKFMTATASEIFSSVKSPPDETAVVIDPPRKGCDENFLTQLMRFGPRTIIYVSCNVHTQARDVGVLVKGPEGAVARYVIRSLQGFDFFPQTGHVEGVAVLERNV